MTKYGFIYITTNLINGKKYLGKRSYKDYSDGKKKWKNYLGSGKLISRAIKKYGKENFKREIIDEAETYEELNELEKYYIRLYNCTDSDEWYNISEGGDGGVSLKPGMDGYEEWKENIKLGLKRSGKSGGKIGRKVESTRGSSKINKPFFIIDLETGEKQRFEQLYDIGEKMGGRFYQAARARLHYEKERKIKKEIKARPYLGRYEFIYEDEL